MGRRGRWEEEDRDVYRQIMNYFFFSFLSMCSGWGSHLPTVNPAARPIINASRQTTANVMAMIRSCFFLDNCINAGNPRAAMVFPCLIPVVVASAGIGTGFRFGTPVRAFKPLSTAILDYSTKKRDARKKMKRLISLTRQLGIRASEWWFMICPAPEAPPAASVWPCCVQDIP